MKRALSISLCVTLLLITTSCGKEDNGGKTILQKGLKGKIIYSSCATIAVQVLNKDIGSEWTNCHNDSTYTHMIDAMIVNRNGMVAEHVFNFNIIEDEQSIRCDMLDCKPPQSVTIVITGD